MYDALAESVRLIGTGVTAGAEPLTRRHRWLPVAYDVDGDLAVTVFLRRGHGGAFWEQHVLTRSRGEWALHGGGGSGADALDVLTRFPTAEDLGGLASSEGGGGVMIGGSGLLGRSRWAQHAQVDVAPTVAVVETARGRRIDRPVHGRLTVAWWGHGPLTLTLRDQAGRPLPPVVIGGDRRRHPA